MNLLNMSFSATVLILVIILIRALLLHKLPKRTFLALWYVTLFRLLVPFKISSPFSIYTVINMLKGSVSESDSGFVGIPVIPNHTEITQTFTPLPKESVTTLSTFMVIWFIGFFVCILFFLVTHLRCRREYKTALPINNNFIRVWQQVHPLKRRIQIRQSDRITTPLTYGIFYPIILLPKQTDGTDETRLHYILTHEFVHIKRFDTLTKLLMATALSVHWFNPFVWLMFVLLNQDIELSCDEAVVRHFGQNIKSAYALTLIGLEEERVFSFSPLINNFNKNAIEERIVSIMKAKKTSLVVILIAIIMITVVTTVFATSATNRNKHDNEITQVTYSSENTDEVIHYPTQGESNNHSSYSEDEYATLMSLKTDGYRELKISEFDSQVKKIQTIYNGYNPNDENVNFMQTLSYSTSELAFSYNNDTPTIGISTGINKKTSNDEYYGAQLSYEVNWTIFDKDKTTVGQRDDSLNACQESIQSILESKSRDELNSINMLSQLQSECNILAKKLTNDFISLQIIINDLTPIKNSDGSINPAQAEAIAGEEITDNAIDTTDSTQDGNVPVTSSSEGMMTPDELAKLYSVYEPFGLTYDKEKDCFYYEGKLVQTFIDILSSNGESLESGKFSGSIRQHGFHEKGEVNIKAVRDYTKLNKDGEGKLVGIEVVE